MWLSVWLVVIGLAAGVGIGMNLPLFLPQAYSKYLGIAILAGLDSVFGGICAAQDERFDNVIFISGFIGNGLVAALLVFIGDRLAVDLYLAAIVAFGVRLFQNLAVIRRNLLQK